MGGKLTKDGVVLPGNEGVTQTKSIISVDGKEADETGNIDLGGAFDYVDKKTQIRGCKALTWNQLRVQGLDDWERHRGSDLGMDEESLTVSSLTGEYVYIAEVDSENKSSAYYRSDNGGATYSRHIVPTEGVDVKLIRTSETGQVVLLSTHIGGVLISKDYGKTWEIPLNLSTSNSKSSWFISMSSNGQNLIYPNSDGNLYLEKPNTFYGQVIKHLLVLPANVTPNSIKEFFLSNDTDRDNIRMVILTRSGNVHVSRNGGEQWSNEGSGFAGIYVDKEITNIYSIKKTSVYIMPINGNGFTNKVDFKDYPKYQNLTKDPNTFQLRSIFVSRDYKTGEDKIAVFSINGGDDETSSENSNFNSSSSEDPDNSEEILTNPNKEKPFTGILISEDSGNTWDLSQIKYTWGWSTPLFNRIGTLDDVVGYPRLQLIENFESGLFIFTNPINYTNLNNIIRISDKSTSYTSSSKVILDGSITLGMSMESDTEYLNKMPGTIEYGNMFDGYHFNFDDSTWIIQEGGSDTYNPSDDFLKPLAIVETKPSSTFGKTVKTVKISNTLEGMEKLESENIEMSSYKDTTNPAKILEMYQGEIRPTSIQTSDFFNIKNFTDLKDTPIDYTKSVNGELATKSYGSGSDAFTSVFTIAGDTRDGEYTSDTNHQNIWDGDDRTYYSMPTGGYDTENADFHYPEESWILTSFNAPSNYVYFFSRKIYYYDPGVKLKTVKISKIILTTGPSIHSGMAGYTFGVYGIINSGSGYGTLEHSYNSTTGELKKNDKAMGVPDGEGVRKEILKGTLYGQTVQGDYLQPDYRIGTSYPHKCVWVLDTPVEVQHLEFRLSRSTDMRHSNVIGGIEIFDDKDNKFVVRLNSEGTELELSDDHETRITSVESDVSTLESSMVSVSDRVTELELREDKDILIYPYYGYFSSSAVSTFDIRNKGTNYWASGNTSWQDIMDGINAAYPPSLYDVGKRLFFKPHTYYNNQINHNNEYMIEYVWLLTVRPAGYSYSTYKSDGTVYAHYTSTAKFWHVEYKGLPRQLNGNEEIDWSIHDGS